MIKHIVLLKENENVTDEKRKILYNQLKDLSQIPGAENVHFGQNFSKLSNGYEIGLTVDFQNKEALKAYNKHPIHLEVVKTLQELKLELAVIDYETTDQVISN